MLVSVSLIDGTDDSMDRTIYTTTLEVPNDTDMDQLAQDLTAEFYANAIAATSEKFQKENAEALEDVNFLRWITVTRVKEVPSTREDFLKAAHNSMLSNGYGTMQENIEVYL